MVFVRRRYYAWLIKAYIKRWKKSILLSLVVGALSFYAILLLFSFYFQPILERKVTKIGLSGNYKLSSIPDIILNEISLGLTRIDENGEVKPSAAASWEIRNDGKVYVIHLKEALSFHNGSMFTSEKIPYNFQDVKKTTPDPFTVIFELKSPYSPFLAAISKPLIINQTDGIGEYIIKDYEVNGDYLKSITIESRNDKRIRKIYHFYPTDEALKIAFLLGDIDSAEAVSSPMYKKINLLKWKNVKIKDSVNYSRLITVFYNNKDKYLSNKKIRQALNYSLEGKYDGGLRSISPIPPSSIFFSQSPNAGVYDVGIAKTLMSTSGAGAEKIKISTTKEFINIAKKVQKSWVLLGIPTYLDIVDDVPTDFQVFIYEFKVPQDPDQYTLWHSNQKNNIIHYKNPRIDKLLENGRVSVDQQERAKIYADFQKYLLDDTPASFLYFPYEYKLMRNNS